jgi:hypothetical protein
MHLDQFTFSSSLESESDTNPSFVLCDIDSGTTVFSSRRVASTIINIGRRPKTDVEPKMAPFVGGSFDADTDPDTAPDPDTDPAKNGMRILRNGLVEGRSGLPTTGTIDCMVSLNGETGNSLNDFS